MVQTLKMAGGYHILVSDEMMKKKIADATEQEIKDERERFMAISFILRSDDRRFKKLNDDFKSSANRGKDEYPEALTNVFNLLARESGEYDTVKG